MVVQLQSSSLFRGLSVIICNLCSRSLTSHFNARIADPLPHPFCHLSLILILSLFPSRLSFAPPYFLSSPPFPSPSIHCVQELDDSEVRFPIPVRLPPSFPFPFCHFASQVSLLSKSTKCQAMICDPFGQERGGCAATGCWAYASHLPQDRTTRKDSQMIKRGAHSAVITSSTVITSTITSGRRR